MAHQSTSSEKPRRFTRFSPFSPSHYGVFTFSALLVFALLMYITSDEAMLTPAQNSFRLRQLRIPPQGHVDATSIIGSASIPSDLVLSKPSGSQLEEDASAPATSNQSSDQVEALIAARSGLTDQSSVCDGRRIYIYPLPAKFNDDLTADCKNWVFRHWSMCDDVFNGGFGQRMNLSADPVASTLLQPPSAWYRTDQFSLEVIFHRRLTTYPCLTSDPTQASLFYLPFYHALDLSRHIYNQNLTVRDELTERFHEWLFKQPSWKLSGGHRHMLVLGRIIWDFRRSPPSTWGSKLLAGREVWNLTKVLIERGYHDDEVAVPYPTNFHPASDAELQSWQATVRGANRTQFVSFAGSSRGPNETKKVRGALFDQCKMSSKCKLVRCTQTICGEQVQTIYKLALESVFCLQPPGDSPTRKGIFDVLVSGCIPVLFHRNQTVEQYMWHLKGNGSEYSVLMDDSAVTTYDVVAHLERIPKAEIQRLQENIVRLLPSFLYRNPKLAGEYTSKDAFDVAIDGVLDKFKSESEL